MDDLLELKPLMTSACPGCGRVFLAVDRVSEWDCSKCAPEWYVEACAEADKAVLKYMEEEYGEHD